MKHRSKCNKAIKLLKEKTKNSSSCQVWQRLRCSPIKSMIHKRKKIDKLDINIKNFYFLRDIIKMKIKPEINGKYISDKGFVAGIFKVLLQLKKKITI